MERHGRRRDHDGDCGAEDEGGAEELTLLRDPRGDCGSHSPPDHLHLDVDPHALHEPLATSHDGEQDEAGAEDEGEETDGEDLLDVVPYHHHHHHQQQPGGPDEEQDEEEEEASRPLPFAHLDHHGHHELPLHLQPEVHHDPFSDHRHDHHRHRHHDGAAGEEDLATSAIPGEAPDHHELQPSLPPPPVADPPRGGEYHHQHQHQQHHYHHEQQQLALLQLQLRQAGVVGRMYGAAASNTTSTASTTTTTTTTTSSSPVAGGRRPPADFRCTSSSEEKWERKFRELVEFKRAHSSFKPLKKANRRLYWWVKDQRAFFRESRLPAHRMEKLVQVGLFEGDTRTVSAKWDDMWEERFSELVGFKEQHGHTFVPNKANAALYAWVRSQRLAKSKGRLNDTRKRRLDEIEFCWTGKQGEAPQRRPGAGGGAKRQKLEIVVDDDQRPAPPDVLAPSVSHTLSAPALMPLPPGLGMEGLNVDHQLFFPQHAALVHQLQQAVAQQETLSLTLAFAPPAGPKVEKTEGEVKAFLDLLSSQNRLFDIGESTATAAYEHEGRSPLHDDPHHQATAKRPPPPDDDNAVLLRPPPQQ